MSGADSKLRWWLVFGLIGPITFVMSLDRTAMVVAAPTIQKEYGFSLVDMSLILTSFSWTYAFLQVPADWHVRPRPETLVPQKRALLRQLRSARRPRPHPGLDLVLHPGPRRRRHRRTR